MKCVRNSLSRLGHIDYNTSAYFMRVINLLSTSYGTLMNRSVGFEYKNINLVIKRTAIRNCKSSTYMTTKIIDFNKNPLFASSRRTLVVIQKFFVIHASKEGS